jgi:hypothetical protein
VPEVGKDTELEARVEAWRRQHQIQEDDPILLVVDLFRIHHHHWESIRQRSIRESPAKPDIPEDASRQPETKAGWKWASWIQRIAAVAAFGLAAGGGFILGMGFR